MLYTAAISDMSPAFISWLVEKAADVHMSSSFGVFPLHMATSAEVVETLLKAGASPTRVSIENRETPLMTQCSCLRTGCVERLLREPKVIETVDQQDIYGRTALFLACMKSRNNELSNVVKMLLRAGANPTIASNTTPLAYVRHWQPNQHALIALLEHATCFLSPRIVLLSKARHITAAHHALTRATPSFLQPRMPALPRVELVPPASSPSTSSHNRDTEGEKEEEDKKYMSVLQYVLGNNEDGSQGGMLDELFVELIETLGPV
jgi:ankyrin repeat protein